ncbi:DNA-3-methyladenine glycosylase I [Marivirga arenosa]|uniref:DNA-3-methyladenine glycosylase I n=1 Tax=Marivirga arenosa TaxID=3059076 RepID=A0AA49JB44_9BACT|nr:DNA-3-methyladenine glycosylase I [Marivirga sp. ABR2-2]WKK86264.1 DNA-3-methyladenine glycosylase I [Marivirga sp. ABR2-2]
MSTKLTDEKERCPWCLGFDQYIRYHDEEWGVSVHDDQTHFEFLLLEGAQAGLSWSTVLKKRDNYRKLFADFNAEKVAQFDQSKIDELLQNPGIIRNKLKVNGAVTNAQKFLEVQKEFGSFDHYIWSFVNHKTIINQLKSLEEAPATSPESDALSKDLKKRGFKFVGSTIMYAHMQACGLVNDHLVSCFRYNEVM